MKLGLENVRAREPELRAGCVLVQRELLVVLIGLWAF